MQPTQCCCRCLTTSDIILVDYCSEHNLVPTDYRIDEMRYIWKTNGLNFILCQNFTTAIDHQQYNRKCIAEDVLEIKSILLSPIWLQLPPFWMTQ